MYYNETTINHSNTNHKIIRPGTLLCHETLGTICQFMFTNIRLLDSTQLMLSYWWNYWVGLCFSIFKKLNFQICAQIHCRCTRTVSMNLTKSQKYFDAFGSFVFFSWTPPFPSLEHLLTLEAAELECCLKKLFWDIA